MDGKICYFRNIEKQIDSILCKESKFRIDALKSYYQTENCIYGRLNDGNYLQIGD
jgi:hypothetical protein